MQTPKHIGRYKILGLLGRGGMGAVYRGHDPALNRPVVVKQISVLDEAQDSHWRERFRREVQAAGQLNHSNIVTIYDVDLDHEPPYVVMELLTGGTLQDRLKQRSLAWQEALFLIRPLVTALNYAHKNGVVHRDVKPANIMFGQPSGILKLVDFGLVQQQGLAQVTQPGTIVGTPAYMSPEQVHDLEVDGRSDIFALGIILCEALTGINPLDKGSVPSTLHEIMSGDQVDMSQVQRVVPTQVFNLIEKAVAKDRTQRYSDCASFLKELDECLGGVDTGLRTIDSRNATEVSSDQTLSPPDIRVRSHINLTPEIETVIQAMFRGFKRVTIEAEFGRGFSGSRAFRILLVEADGRVRLPETVKVGPTGSIQSEWRAYERWVQHILPKTARLGSPPVFPDNHSWAGLHYDLVGDGVFPTQSLKEYFQEATIDDIRWVLENRLFEIMAPNWWLDNKAERDFQMQADYDPLLPVNFEISLTTAEKNGSQSSEPHIIDAGGKLPPPRISAGTPVQVRGFEIRKVDKANQQVTLNLPLNSNERLLNSCRIRVTQVSNINDYEVGKIIDSISGIVTETRHDLFYKFINDAFAGEVDLSAEEIPLINKLGVSLPESVPNPLQKYRDFLDDVLPVRVATVHGDLNVENILVDTATRDVKLIDFATVRRAHVLHDLLRLETEVVITLLPATLRQADLPAESIIPLYERLHNSRFDPEQFALIRSPLAALDKEFKILWLIRRMARKCLFDQDNWQEYYYGAVLYLLGASKFKAFRHSDTGQLSKQSAFWGAAMLAHLLETPPIRQEPSVAEPVSPPPVFDTTELKPPAGTMHPESRFYIERVADKHCWEYLDKAHATTIFIQAPRQTGKSSLMRRGIFKADSMLQKPTAFIDFQKFPEQYFADEKKFLVEFCLMIGDALGVPEAIDQYWQERRTNIFNCEQYISKHIIAHLNKPFILAMDEVDKMLTSSFQGNFFGMLRTWHNERAHNPAFGLMTIFLSSSTEPYLFITDPTQSPFNVAEKIILQDFTLSEVEKLNEQYEFPLKPDQIAALRALVGGHPFLIHSALYQVATGKITVDTLLAQATKDHGPFDDHLSFYLRRVLQSVELKDALAQICQRHTYEENQTFHRLKGAGLIKREGSSVVLRNRLYTIYFEEHLNV